MKIVYQLNKQDLCDILARIYKTDRNNVHLYSVAQAVGYGRDSNMEHVPHAEIRVECPIGSIERK